MRTIPKFLFTLLLFGCCKMNLYANEANAQSVALLRCTMSQLEIDASPEFLVIRPIAIIEAYCAISSSAKKRRELVYITVDPGELSTLDFFWIGLTKVKNFTIENAYPYKSSECSNGEYFQARGNQDKERIEYCDTHTQIYYQAETKNFKEGEP
jgi:hypothetical protein